MTHWNLTLECIKTGIRTSWFNLYVNKNLFSMHENCLRMKLAQFVQRVLSEAKWSYLDLFFQQHNEKLALDQCHHYEKVLLKMRKKENDVFDTRVFFLSRRLATIAAAARTTTIAKITYTNDVGKTAGWTEKSHNQKYECVVSCDFRHFASPSVRLVRGIIYSNRRKNERKCFRKCLKLHSKWKYVPFRLLLKLARMDACALLPTHSALKCVLRKGKTV